MSSVQPRPRTRKSPQQRSAEILAAATELARAQGLSALTLRAVADRAGVASGLVAHYHPSMDETVAAVFDRLVGAEVAEVRDLLRSGPANERLAVLFRTLLDGTRSDITLVWVEGWALGRQNAPLADAIERQMRSWQVLMAGVIDDGIAAGEFSVADADAVAWQLLAMIDGLTAQALVRGSDPAPFLAQLARAAEVLVGARPGAIPA